MIGRDCLESPAAVPALDRTPRTGDIDFLREDVRIRLQDGVIVGLVFRNLIILKQPLVTGHHLVGLLTVLV